MIIFFAIVLTLVVVIFGLSSVMQSYASAQQAQATIETAKAAQMANFENILAILIAMLIVISVIALMIYFIIRRANRQIEHAPRRHTGIWKTSAAVLPAPEEHNQFIVEHLTSEQLRDLAEDLFDLMEK